MVTITIDATSIDTDNDDRDKHLRSEDFFDVARHPKITFVSTNLMADGKNKTRVEGTLTLRGVSKPVTLEVEFLGAGPDAWGGFRSGIEARTTINRKDFGITWNKALDTGGWVLGEEVDILLNIEGVRQAAAPEEAAG
jgi:polyisoprenoid-binding protein YceI